MRTNFLPNGGMGAVNRLAEEMDRLFGGEFWKVPGLATAGLTTAGGYPPINAWETPDGLYVETEIPGMGIGDVEIGLEDDVLTISGDRKPPAGEVTWHRRERGTGRFERKLRLPFPIENEKVDAHLVNGVLSLKLPKAESAKPRKIEVKSA